MKIIVLDRENEQALLRKGLVPRANCLPPTGSDRILSLTCIAVRAVMHGRDGRGHTVLALTHADRKNHCLGGRPARSQKS